MGTTHQI